MALNSHKEIFNVSSNFLFYIKNIYTIKTKTVKKIEKRPSIDLRFSCSHLSLLFNILLFKYVCCYCEIEKNEKNEDYILLLM